jgi:uncharacterized protein YbjT (DUF2867 family)
VHILITGITGYVGDALVPRLARDGHLLRGLARDPLRVRRTVGGPPVPIVRGDVVTGAGLDEALEGVDVAYYLVHSMERASARAFREREEAGAMNFAVAARRAGVRRVVYLGGLLPPGSVPPTVRLSPHLASRLAVEQILLAGVPDAVALRASIVVGARSRSFRFLVRLVERAPVLPLPPWARFRTRPIDGRDMVELLARAAVVPEAGGRSLDVAGPDVLTYGEMIERIRDLLIVGRPTLRLPIGATAIASRVAAAIAGEDPELIGPLMGSLETDLLPRDDVAAGLLGVRLHGFDAAVERALRDWEEMAPGTVAAR